MSQRHIIHRSPKNPIITPSIRAWESRAVFNPTAIDINGTIYILYRAMSEDNTSVIGLAKSRNGITIKERIETPIYIPREPFEDKIILNNNSGCEDPRITRIGDDLYMCYTAYNGRDVPAVALTHISVKNFTNGMWKWSKPVIVSAPHIDDKDACILPFGDGPLQYLVHRTNNSICLSTINLRKPAPVEKAEIILHGRPGHWDSMKVGICSVPFLTKHGWFMLYHGVGDDGVYRIGAALLDKNNPAILLSRTFDWIFAPEMDYEKVGQVNNVVFPCGTVVRENILYIYYGAGDSTVCVASASLDELLNLVK